MTRSCLHFSNILRMLLVGLLLMINCPAPNGQQPKVVFLPEIGKVEFIHAVFTPDSDGSFGSAVIPLKRAGRLFLIEATVDGETGNFVFDTGADKMVLNKTYFRKDLLASEGSGGGLTGNSQVIYVTQVKKIVASGLMLENLTVDVTELGQIENRRKSKILGLMGMQIFSGMEMEIDLRNASLTLTKASRKNKPDESFTPTDTCDFKGKINLVRKIMFLRGTVGGRILDFCLDTGAETNVLSSDAPKKVLETLTIKNRGDLTGVGGADAEVLFGTMNDFNLGKHKLGPMQTIVANLTALSLAYDYPVTGILGFDFFDQGVICINLVTKEMSMSFHERGAE